MSAELPPVGIVVEPDIYDRARYVGLECLFGVHHACPGGLKGDAKTGGDWVCRCPWEACPCHRTT